MDVTARSGIIAITGGAGFLGRRVAALACADWAQVRSVDLVPYPADDEAAPHIQSFVADLTKPQALDAAFSGADTVIHAAAVVDIRPRPNPMLEAVNVEGTRLVIEACRRQNVRQLVVTTTMDVAYDGTPRQGADESTPYPEQPANQYIRSKIAAERLAIAANGPDLSVCVLRPTGIYGPHDRHRLGALVPLVRKGTLSVLFGDGSSTFDHVYVDNVAHAHLLAARALATLGSKVAGQCYFVGDHGYANFFAFLAPFFEAVGAPLPKRTLPRAVALLFASIAQGTYRAMGRLWRSFNPELSRYSVDALTQDFHFSWQKAARDFGYQPLVTREDAFNRTVAWARAAKL